MTFGVRAIFEESDFSEVIECNDYRLVSQKIEKHAPDIVLFDLHMPLMSLERDFQNLHRKHPSDIFVAYTADFDATLIARCKSLGFRGYLLKAENVEALKRKIQAILAGGTVFPDVEGGTSGVPATLTAMQINVLKLMAAGYKNSEIAKALGISEATVDYHKRNIKETLNSNTSAESVAIGKANGWLYPPLSNRFTLRITPALLIYALQFLSGREKRPRSHCVAQPARKTQFHELGFLA